MAYYYKHPSTYIDSDGKVVPSSVYERCFIYGTNINGVYCTGMTVSQVEKELIEKTDKNVYQVVFKGKTYDISPEEIDYTISYTDKLNQVMKKQNALLWPKILFEGSDYIEISPDVSYSKEKLSDILDSIGILENKVKKSEVYISFSDEGYVLNDTNEPILDAKAARNHILEDFDDGKLISAVDESFYTEYVYTDKENKLIDYYNKIEDFQKKYVAYIFGKEKKCISKKDWAILLNTDEILEKITCDMVDTDRISFEIDKENAKNFIDGFLDEYNTLNNRYFKTHSGEIVYVKKGTYGNKIDLEREEDWFAEFVNSNETSCTRVPVYLKEAKYKEKNDFGDTFIEISIDEQHMWYYVDGKIYVETDITSGSLANGGTAPRVCAVYSIIPNKWLNGPTWHSFVKYWVAIDGAIGIHDASWRSVYGGKEYLYNGSHGCVNTPHDAMKKLFERVELGTPVIVYSIEKNGVDKQTIDAVKR